MKNRWMASLMTLLVVFFLAACSDEETTNKEGNVTSSPKEETQKEEETKTSDKKEVNKEVANSENIHATLISVEHIVDKEWDEEKIEVKFEVENKRQDTIDVQAREVSVDGKMVDEGILTMSQEISAGKMADAVLTIQDYEGGELPELKENLEMILHIFSWDDMEFAEDHKVIIDF